MLGLFWGDWVWSCLAVPFLPECPEFPDMCGMLRVTEIPGQWSWYHGRNAAIRTTLCVGVTAWPNPDQATRTQWTYCFTFTENWILSNWGYGMADVTHVNAIKEKPCIYIFWLLIHYCFFFLKLLLLVVFCKICRYLINDKLLYSYAAFACVTFFIHSLATIKILKL